MTTIVLGAGAVGTATAWYLSKSGHDVVLIERQKDAAMETSWGNGGVIHASEVEPWSQPGMPMKIIKWLGKENAPLVLIEYTDYQCPFCQRYHNDSFAQIKTNFIDTGKIRYISRDFPLPFHENARRSATAARCAAEQGKFWELRHTMIVNANQLQADKLGGYAQAASMDVPKFQACVDSDKYRAAIDKDIAEGSAAGVSGTPSFVLGRVENGQLQGVRMVGAMPYAQFEAKIQDMLKQTAKN